MEAFSGVLICFTNVFSAIAPVALRRFAFKVGFKPLSDESRLKLFKSGFSDVELPIEVAERLARLEGLTSGDFKVVLSRMRFSISTPRDIMGMLQNACGYKVNPIRVGC
jgi:SpoVK/Ycf46/Vps4 family AAA+-type ATPase